MTKSIIKEIEIKTGVNSNYLENTLTTDITVLESIFDLIDNSIDAARDHLISKNFERDIYGLPVDYSGYKIIIRLGKKSISVLDNCLGMDESTLSLHAFRTADTSSHKYGIGHYGLGLKRALLKFGRQFSMSSDNGSIAFKMHFDSEMISGDKKLMAAAYSSSGHRKTLFVVSEVKSNIQYEIQSQSWFENAIKVLKIRYAAYTAKGLRISISNSYFGACARANGNLPTIRKNSKFTPISKPVKVEGVDVYIDSGVHGKYYFPAEDGYSLAMNKTLTDEFGLYFICNDRVIVSSSTANEHGWKTKWHSEYNGFICIVRFVSEDPQKMPWNTLKTALKTDGRLFVQVRDELQPIADLYRQSVKKLYSTTALKNPLSSGVNGGNSNESVSLRKNDELVATSIRAGDGKQKPFPSAGKNQQMHPKNWDTVLPVEFPHSADPVLNGFIIEAINLRCDVAPCASAILLRAILESSLRQFVKKSKNFEAVKNHFYSSSEGEKKNHSEAQRAIQGIDLVMMLAWISDERVAINIFGIEEKPRLWLASKKAKMHTKKLNGIVHGLDLMDTSQIQTIRNEIYLLLKFCVEKSLTN
ncbi:ATP-binding protein [Rhodoferax sp.]|uniref:ATP-binding protein n=1 Tax=Rhodoferax sp. TaxID=50421 RepID=UPI002ACE14D6|nr:ATP-binding protein [Rhodoferax sp.]MDZ7922278.1 ATP-binding protein [Rhodoferax sp.]